MKYRSWFAVTPVHVRTPWSSGSPSDASTLWVRRQVLRRGPRSGAARTAFSLQLAEVADNDLHKLARVRQDCRDEELQERDPIHGEQRGHNYVRWSVRVRAITQDSRTHRG
jgi:hypothetical protein